jgi:hypothetical protein
MDRQGVIHLPPVQQPETWEVVMREWQIGMSECEQKLRTYCLEVAGELGLKVDRTHWAEYYINERRILTVIAETGTPQIRFSQQELDDYASEVNKGAADKIREELKDILD